MILVGIGGIFGALTRYLISKQLHSAYPWATLLINSTGSFALGLLFALQPAAWLWQLLGIGFLGAYTTFSTFGFETVQLIEQQKGRQACLYISSSVLIGLLSALLGFMIIQ
ncbi:fluoride efflux transporter CrcB [Lysinibacillus piscis]|uniref:Fluoride-specific ion channel FluC n=1 Tax=Lysinibacillus piscis TaxID=2518931 RepID=A0ABQ5NLK5_9BACI|nr:fluoride efflux transporter CrcB [Lysinibacillus sp. KH24]GLC89174.1 putative fluoride ion transporter CrcB 2 [Lysinibacillus sp. KH24]